MVGAEVGQSGGLGRAVGLVERRGAAAQLWVARGGEVLLDRSFGCGAHDLFWLFSASKPWVTVLLFQLVESGEVELDAPVAAYWPQFAGNGKGGITLRHVLQHRSGLPTATRGLAGTARLAGRSPFADAGMAVGALRDSLAMTDWERSVRRIERARPRWAPGEVPAYQYVDFGFIVGEVVRRVTGAPVAEVLREQVVEPLGLRDTFLGLPRTELGRAVPMRGRGPYPRAMARFVNRPSVRMAPIPAAGISTTARDLGAFYGALLGWNGGRLVSEASLRELTTPSCEEEIDRFVHIHIRWAQGLQLGGPRRPPITFSPMGRASSPRAFGHNGSNVAIGWADPDRDLTFAYVTNLATGYLADYTHLADVADAVLEAVE